MVLPSVSTLPWSWVHHNVNVLLISGSYLFAGSRGEQSFNNNLSQYHLTLRHHIPACIQLSSIPFYGSGYTFSFTPYSGRKWMIPPHPIQQFTLSPHHTTPHLTINRSISHFIARATFFTFHRFRATSYGSTIIPKYPLDNAQSRFVWSHV